MGEKNNAAGRLYFVGPVGGCFTVGEITCDILGDPDIKDIKEKINIAFDAWPELEARFKLPKSLRCSSRKRLIKLLMSTGTYGRNTATKIAESFAAWGVSYEAAWHACLFWRWGIEA